MTSRTHLIAPLALLVLGCGGPLSPPEEYDAAIEAVERWIAQNPSDWSVAASGTRRPGRTEWSEPCSESPPSGFVALEATAGNTRLHLFFRCPISTPATAADLGLAFNHVVLDRLPHGLAVPNWRFEIFTPSSSFSEGVTFSTPSAGRLRIDIQTTLYGAYGHSTRASCVPMADGPSAEGCYLFREHRIPLTLRLSVPWAGTELN